MLSRFLVSFLLLPPLSYIVLKGEILFFLTIELCIAVMLKEFYSMIEKRVKVNKIIGIIYGLTIPILFFFSKNFKINRSKILLFIIVFTTISFIINRIIKEETGEAVIEIAYIIFSIIYIPVMFSYLVLIKNIDKEKISFFKIIIERGRLWLIITFAVAFISDSSAYFIGKMIGKTPLSPKISPKKSKEGFVAAIISGTLVVIFMKIFYIKTVPMYKALILGISSSLMGQLGDLGSSLFKRDFGIKDTSKLLLDHGGLLDRCDSLIFISPFIYYFIKFLL